MIETYAPLSAASPYFNEANSRSAEGEFAYAVKVAMGLAFVTVAAYFSAPSLLRPLFPATTALAGYLIYRRDKLYFLSFYLWISVLAPTLRRLVDWRTGYQDQSMILLAPLLLALLPAIHFRRDMRIAPQCVRLIACLTLGAIAFGAGIGMIRHPGVNVLRAVASWSAPIIMCVFAASIESGNLRKTLTRTLAWAVLIMSIYGIYQFIVAPPWDTYWLRQVSATAVAPSFGRPAPFSIRVWSTMNSPGACAVILSASLVWLFTQEGLLAFVAELLGYVTLMLTLVRSAWLQTGLSLLLVLLLFRSKSQVRRTAVKLCTLILGAVAILGTPQAADIKQRFSTLASLNSDASYNERTELYRYIGSVVVTNPLGIGLDIADTNVHGYPLDSSVLILVYMLGWPGASMYILALLIVVVSLSRSIGKESGAANAASYIVIATLFQSVSGDVLFRQGGLVLWLFFGIWASTSKQARLPSQVDESFVSATAAASVL